MGTVFYRKQAESFIAGAYNENISDMAAGQIVGRIFYKGCDIFYFAGALDPDRICRKAYILQEYFRFWRKYFI
jgi:hypothetical protein